MDPDLDPTQTPKPILGKYEFFFEFFHVLDGSKKRSINLDFFFNCLELFKNEHKTLEKGAGSGLNTGSGRIADLNPKHRFCTMLP